MRRPSVLARSAVIATLVGVRREKHVGIRPRRHDRENLSAGEQPKPLDQLRGRGAEPTTGNGGDAAVVGKADGLGDEDIPVPPGDGIAVSRLVERLGIDVLPAVQIEMAGDGVLHFEDDRDLAPALADVEGPVVPHHERRAEPVAPAHRVSVLLGLGGDLHRREARLQTRLRNVRAVEPQFPVAGDVGRSLRRARHRSGGRGLSCALR